MLDEPSANQKHHITSEPPGLAKIVSRHNDFHAGACNPNDDLLDAFGRGRIEASGWLIQEQDFRVAGECAGKRQSLLLAARQSASRSTPEAAKPYLVKQMRDDSWVGWAAGGRQRERDVRSNASPQHHGLLKDDGTPGPCTAPAAAESDASGGRCEEFHAEL